MKVGHRQQGILLVNVSHGLVENNIISVYAKGNKLGSISILKQRQNRTEIRKALIYKVQLGQPSVPDPNANVVLGSGANTVRFTSHNDLRNTWSRLLAENPLAGTITSKALLAHIKKLTDRLLIDEAFRNRYPAFRERISVLLTPDRAVASQVITIGGQRVTSSKLGFSLPIKSHAAFSANFLEP